MAIRRTTAISMTGCPRSRRGVRAKHGITLPTDYRYVVTQIANGVRGVFFPLGKEQMRGEDYTRDYEALGLIGDIGQPFPLTEAWNLPGELLREPEPPDEATGRRGTTHL
jgi:hypothetical protein